MKETLSIKGLESKYSLYYILPSAGLGLMSHEPRLLIRPSASIHQFGLTQSSTVPLVDWNWFTTGSELNPD